MRLKQEDVTALAEILAAHLKTSEARLYLYGSRADDALKGGDIDLALVLKDAAKARELSAERHVILSEIKKRLGDQRIDFSVISERDAKADPFFLTALRGAKLLKQW